MHIFDTNLRKLTPQTCFEDVTADGTNTILLIPDREIDTDNLMNSEAGPSIPEPNPEDGSDNEETVHKRVDRRDSS